MTSETKSCQNCKQSFVIEAQDFDFYKKIDVPPPTFCPDCRMQRRMTYRNERSLYKRKCELTGKDIISCFSPESGIHVYDRDIWWSDKWDPLQYAQDYDFSKPFFAQFQELSKKVPMPAVFNGLCINTPYGNHLAEVKDSYLVSACGWGENLAYVSQCAKSKDSLDLYACNEPELCYEDVASEKIYQTFFSVNTENCAESYFLFDCKGCTNCFGCVNLRNKQYYIFNEPYTKEEYFKKLKEFDLGSHQTLEDLKQKFATVKARALYKYANLINTKNVTGHNVSQATNCHNVFDVWDKAQDSKYLVHSGWGIADVYDGYGVGDRGELIYEVVDCGIQVSRMLFGVVVWTGNNVRYSFNCQGNNNLFGCIGLRGKEYCILNKQYSETEYKELVPKIIQQMNDMPYTDKKGRVYKYGEFFPSEISPYAYNETIAQDYFPLTSSQADSQGFRWRERDVPQYQATMKATELPDHIKDVDDEILKQIIVCASCERPYRIIKMELDFLNRFNLALPRYCFECRHQARFRKVNLPRLYKRQCMCDYQIYKNSVSHGHHPTGQCANVFQTTYAPDRKETVYCEACYNAEIV